MQSNGPLPASFFQCLLLVQICNLSFAIIHSTTIVLPAWRAHCVRSNLPICLLPCNVVTRWNSTYDMLVFAVKYRKPIDAITADKALKLRKYELFQEDWVIVKDLVAVLKVHMSASVMIKLTMPHRNTKMQHSSSPKTRPASQPLYQLWTRFRLP